MTACSGTIETPTEENPPRRTERAANPSGATANTTPRQMTPASNANQAPPPVAATEEDEPPVNEPEEPEEPEEEEETPPAPPPEDLSFEADIYPIFAAQCVPCHSTLGSGGQNLAAPDIDDAFDDSVAFEDAVIVEIAEGTMPPSCGAGSPGDPNCLSVEDAAMVEAWYEAGAEP